MTWAETLVLVCEHRSSLSSCYASQPCFYTMDSGMDIPFLCNTCFSSDLLGPHKPGTPASTCGMPFHSISAVFRSNKYFLSPYTREKRDVPHTFRVKSRLARHARRHRKLFDCHLKGSAQVAAPSRSARCPPNTCTCRLV